MMRSLLSLMLCALMTGCSSLMGVGCGARHDNPNVQSLMQQACTGDREAQFTLGDMYERGDGVEQNDTTARAYYEAAAASESGTTYIYVPAAGNVAGFTMPVQSGTPHPGHPAAKKRLEQMNEKEKHGQTGAIFPCKWDTWHHR